MPLSVDPLWLLFLLLPVAAWSGWRAARRFTARDEERERTGLRTHYFRGISYLLNEQPDKAIEAFIKVLEVDSETVETHLALGNLYRRRGEVDRAIRIHQNLIARPTLSEEQRSEALLELGQDYLSAGLLDRAENLFQELVDVHPYRERALRQMLDIYEQEKDWEKSIHTARAMEGATGRPFGEVIAQYHCEIADAHAKAGRLEQALEFARRALDSDRDCVRASLLEGDLLARQGDPRGAIQAYERVEGQAPDYVPEIVTRIQRFLRDQDRAEAETYLENVMQRHGGMTSVLAVADRLLERSGPQAAIAFTREQLARRPSVRGLHRLTELELGVAHDGEREHLLLVKDITARLLKDRPVYKCRHCGFPARSLHWQCPGCKHWNTVEPIQGVEGE